MVWLPRIVIVSLVALVYSNAIRTPFLFDDAGAVLKNGTIRNLGSWAVLSPPQDGSTTTGRPLVNLSFAINYWISGSDPWSYHVVNVALHALCALLVFGILFATFARMPTSGVGEGRARLLSFSIAMMWAVHPLNTETVVCVAQRTEGLCALLYLLTLYGFVRASTSGVDRPGWRVVSVIACAAGMASKEVMVTAPVIVLLYDRTFVAGSFLGALRQRRLYYTALGCTWLLLGALLLHGGGSRGASAGFGLGVTPWLYLLQQARAVVLYLRLSFWPHPLVLDYGTGVPSSLADVWWEACAVVALLSATTWALIKQPALGFAGAWFFVILAPSSSVVPLISQSMAEHRTYLPLIAVIGVVAFQLHKVLASRAQGILTMLAVGVLSGVTFERNRDYADTLLIWKDTVEKYPVSARGHNNYALELQSRGRVDEANREFALAVSLDPNYVSARYNWGVALLEQQRPNDAVQQLQTATVLSPNFADAHLNLGIALLRGGRRQEALDEFERALKLQPDAPDIHFNLGLALDLVGRHEAAVPHLQAAVESRPDWVEAHYRLARIADDAGRFQEARNRYEEVLRRDPRHAAAEAGLGVLLARNDKLDTAEIHLRNSVRLRPDDPDTLSNLGNVLLLRGKAQEAIQQYEASLRLRPDDAGTRQNLAIARESVSATAR